MSSNPRPVVIDVDDLWHPSQIDELLLPLWRANSRLLITAYAIPNKLGPVHSLTEQYPWLTFAQHGFEHSAFECLPWTYDEATYYLRRGRELGYAPLFKAPNWITTEEIEQACADTNTILHIHPTYTPIGPDNLRLVCENDNAVTWLHTHIARNRSTDFISDLPAFHPTNIANIESFWPVTARQIVAGRYRATAARRGRR